MFMNELIVKFKVATCPIYIQLLCHVIALSSINNYIRFTLLQYTTCKRTISIRYKLIMNIISMKDFYGHQRYVVHFVAFQFELFSIFYC